MRNTICISILLFATAAGSAEAAVFTASGATPGDIQATVDSFRATLGANNGAGGTFPGGRRELNWDGVPNNLSAPNNMPADFFNVNSPRGAVFSTSGSGFQVSATSTSGTAVEFGNLDPSYINEFQVFSPQRLFTAIGSNTLQVDFFIPGTTTPATVSGFGAVFTDVETVGSTYLTVFLADGTNGGQFLVPVSVSGGLSFLGLTDTSRYSRIIIQSGNATLGAGILDNPAGGVDLVAMDDFIYGEPQANGVPEPGSMLLTAFGAAAVLLARRYRRK
ncbi:MAG: PEP-CTERM sorting domain-containing protein [Bryobacteraceae bacterium]